MCRLYDCRAGGGLVSTVSTYVRLPTVSHSMTNYIRIVVGCTTPIPMSLHVGTWLNETLDLTRSVWLGPKWSVSRSGLACHVGRAIRTWSPWMVPLKIAGVAVPIETVIAAWRHFGGHLELRALPLRRRLVAACIAGVADILVMVLVLGLSNHCRTSCVAFSLWRVLGADLDYWCGGIILSQVL
jgi:hypothetical protein